MKRRQWLGLTSTQSDLAHRLLAIAQSAGDVTWRYEAGASLLRSGDRVINLANLYLEYSRAPRSARANLLEKYGAMISPPTTAQVAALWSVGQTHPYPLLRSRFERTTIDIQRRGKDPMPPRAAQPFLGNLETVLGYDLGPTVTQVQQSAITEWGFTSEAALERARMNLRALPQPHWVSVEKGLWALRSAAGYADSFLQWPKLFERLPAHGMGLAMIPNRGVLLATGSEETGGLVALLNAAKKSMQEVPWPLSSDLYRLTPEGAELYDPHGAASELLATLQRIDLAGVYQDQKAALESYHESIQTDVFVATFALLSKKGHPEVTQSWCSWTQGISSLLPVTDAIALVWDLHADRMTALVPWTNAERLVGHYFQSTDESPARVRVDGFPTAEELRELQSYKTS